MKFERDGFCKNCRQGFFYFSDYEKGRPREYCDQCRPIVKANQNSERQFNWRNRSRAKRQLPQQPEPEVSRPAVGVAREDTERVAHGVADRGMYRDLPEPGRTEARRKVGLS